MPSHPGPPPVEPPAAASGPCDPGPPADHRRGPRRRGQLLFEAIFEATVAELTETGYAGLAMERIAARARTSKASLYRRWPSRADLVVDAIRHCSPELSHPPDTGNLREDLLSLLRGMADRLDGPFGEALRGVLADTLADPGRTAAARSRMTGLGGEIMAKILARAAARGEVCWPPPGPCAVRAAPVLLLHHYLTHGPPVSERVLAEIVDEVALPLICAQSLPPAPGAAASAS
jgi:AcrR family transcriptional regulator